jgi:glycosyltransferase involved in cell wall biosynthesis
MDGIRILRVWSYIAPNAGVFPRFANFLSYMASAVGWTLTRERPDVIVATTPQFFCGWAGVIVGRLRGIPTVLDVRDIWPESIERVGAMRQGIVIRLLERLERAMYRGADEVVTVTQGCLDHIRAVLPMGRHVSLITNGVDPAYFSPLNVPGDFKQRWARPDQVVCSYVGTIGLGYDFELLLDAAEILRSQKRGDLVFWMVGDGSRRVSWESAVQKRGLESHIRFLGRQDREATRAVIASSDCLVIPYKDDDFFNGKLPFKMFEFMAMGKPTILAGRGEAADVIHQACAGKVIEPGNPDALLAAVDELSRQPDDTLQPHPARNYALEHFDVNRLAEKYLELLKRVVLHRQEVRKGRASVRF